MLDPKTPLQPSRITLTVATLIALAASASACNQTGLRGQEIRSQPYDEETGTAGYESGTVTDSAESGAESYEATGWPGGCPPDGIETGYDEVGDTGWDTVYDDTTDEGDGDDGGYEGSGSDTGEPPYCGDGIVQPDEQCDMGDDNGPDKPCTDDCRMQGPT